MLLRFLEWVQQFRIQLSERLQVVLYVALLFIFSKFNGQTAVLPVGRGGSYLTTVEFWATFALPLALVGVLLMLFSQALTARKEARLMRASGLRALFRLEEFWITALGLAAAVLEITGYTLFDAGTQALAVNGLLGCSIWLLYSYTQRAPGQINTYQTLRSQTAAIAEESPPK